MIKIFCDVCKKELTAQEIHYCDEMVGTGHYCSEHMPERSDKKWVHYKVIRTKPMEIFIHDFSNLTDDELKHIRGSYTIGVDYAKADNEDESGRKS